MSPKLSFLWSAPQEFPPEHLLDPTVLEDFAAFLEDHKGRCGLKGEAVAKYLKDYAKAEGIKFARDSIQWKILDPSPIKLPK